MRRAAIVTAIVGMLVSLADAPLAQVTDGLAIEVVVSEVSPTRGEVLRGGSSIPADRIDKTISTAYLGFHENTCGNLSRMATPADVSGTAEQVEGSAGRMMPSDSTWVVDVTPLRVTADVATFKVRWVRTRDNRRRSSQPSGEMELSLRPGQSLPLDMSSASPPLGGSEPCVRCV